jgi:hypothetical protein
MVGKGERRVRIRIHRFHRTTLPMKMMEKVPGWTVPLNF